MFLRAHHSASSRVGNIFARPILSVSTPTVSGKSVGEPHQLTIIHTTSTTSFFLFQIAGST